MKDIIAPLTAAGIIFGGGAFLYLTLALPGARVDTSHIIVSTLMGGAAQYLFGDAMQKRVTDNQPNLTATSGPPGSVTVTRSPEVE